MSLLSCLTPYIAELYVHSRAIAEYVVRREVSHTPTAVCVVPHVLTISHWHSWHETEIWKHETYDIPFWSILIPFGTYDVPNVPPAAFNLSTRPLAPRKFSPHVDPTACTSCTAHSQSFSPPKKWLGSFRVRTLNPKMDPNKITLQCKRDH